MIQIYAPNNHNYDFNGDFELDPITCELTMELNGAWSLEMSHPVDERMNSIVENAVISVDTPIGQRQLFRITEKEKDDEMIRIYASPIFLDCANNCMLLDCRPTNKTGQQALDIMTDGTIYKGYSDIIDSNTAYYIYKNLAEAICSDDENSFLNRWGGEILYKNFDIYINRRIGTDRGMHAEFGYNLTGISEKVNMENVVTQIIPKAYNGYTLPKNEVVDSPNLSKYPIVYTKIIEYSDIKLQEDCSDNEVGYKTLNDLYKALREAARKEFENGIDKPLINYDVSIVDLAQTDAYKNYEMLVKVSLGDTVHCRHKRLDIETDARVIKIVFDCITQSITSLTLGEYEESYLDKLSSVYQSVTKVIDKKTNTLLAEKINGIIDATKAQLRHQKDIAKKQDVRAILFEDLDPKSSTFGAMCLGSLGFQIANKRTLDGLDWDWTTAATANGIIADTISAGVIQGIQLLGNTISNGNDFFVDADGKMKCKDAEIEGNIIGGSITGNTTVNVGTDLNVGNNVYLGDQSTDEVKSIYLNEKTYITLFQNAIKFNIKGACLYFNDSSLSYEVNGKEIFNISNISGLTLHTFGGERYFQSDDITTILKSIRIEESATIKGNLWVDGSMAVKGSKNRVVTTSHGNIKMNAVESADCRFTDEGQITLDEDGKATIFFDAIWLETVNTELPYHIQLTPYCEVSPWMVEEHPDKCIIAGKPDTKVNWHVSAFQKGYENTRLEKFERGDGND